jgi:hypothetical protein
MLKSHFIFENPFLSVSAGLIVSSLFISASIQYGFAAVPSGVYQGMKIFLYFNHALSALEWCELHLFASLLAKSGAIALLVNLVIFGVFLFQLVSFVRRWEHIRIRQRGDTPSAMYLDLWNLGNQYFLVVRAIVLFVIGWLIAAKFLQLNDQPGGFEQLDCSVLRTHNVYKILAYPLVAAISCYCFIRSMKDAILALIGISDRWNSCR